MPSFISQVQHNTTLDIYKDAPSDFRYMRANKIVCTIGPKTQAVEKIKELIGAGLAVVRNNFSHGSYEYHAQTIANARQAAKECGRSDIAIALDTKGPEIRTGNFPGGEVMMAVGDKVVVTTDRDFYDKGTKDKFYVDYKNITKVMKPGQKLFIDDGLLSLEVNRVNPDDLECTVVNAAPISNHKGVNLPNVNVDLPAVTDKDKQDLAFGAEQDVDMVFASFIRTPQQVLDVRAALGEKGKHIQIIAKIENHEGVQNFDDILKEADGVMVARGDLGIEIPAEKVFVAQKMMIAKCNVAGKPVICATQMLESMTNNPRPTRAEVSDVANAVLDGADCVMLSGETAKGKYPAICVETMARVCLEAQSATQGALMFMAIRSMQKEVVTEESIASSSVNAAFELGVRCIIVLTNSGRTARLIAKYRPPCPIFCVTKNARTARQLAIVRHCFSFVWEQAEEDPDREKRVEHVVAQLREESFLRPGDRCVLVHADAATIGFANQTRIMEIR
eukprot:TRINITY_DN15098_c0_g1_i1.p1 TRINITY_DN15098_c0_g1~~TRINITY_DN15098_c0_g1_i1.p1  ORF type:complete len:505 (+),score=203.50 TRINITY_DN15098_c0_g1_i1:87-1601(+)